MAKALLRVGCAAVLAASTARAQVPLTPGFEQAGFVGFNAYTYYTTQLTLPVAADNSTGEVYALLSLYKGDASIVINLGNGRPSPTMASADYTAASVVYLPLVSQTIYGTDAAWVTNCGVAATTCAATIGVFGVQPANYSIAVTVSRESERERK